MIAGAGDGTAHAVKVNRRAGVALQHVQARRQRGFVAQNNVIVSHTEENYDTNEMGLLAAVDRNADKGEREEVN